MYNDKTPYYGKLSVACNCASCNEPIDLTVNNFFVKDTKKTYHFKCRLSEDWISEGSNYDIRKQSAKEWEKKPGFIPQVKTISSPSISLSDMNTRLTELEALVAKQATKIEKLMKFILEN